MFEKTRQWIEVRLGLNEIIDSQLREFNVPRDANVMSTLGAVALVAFFVQAITGIFLLMYYIPHPEHAFASIQIINNKVPYGWLFRTIHVVGSNVILVVLFLHLLLVLYRVSYKKPREMTWISGGIMYVFIFLFCITGYLLSWNQVSYWSTTIITTIPTFFPVLGDYVAGFLRGGDYVNGATLNRFFAFHVAFLPFIFVFMVGVHILLVFRIGFSRDPRSSADAGTTMSNRFQKEVHSEGIPYYPNYLLKELYMAMMYLAVLFFIITFFPTLFQPQFANLEANPLMTPEVIRPPWYFLAPYQTLRLIPNKFVGISVLIVLLGIFILWPFIDAKEERNILKRPLLRGLIILSVVLWVILTIWGRY